MTLSKKISLRENEKIEVVLAQHGIRVAGRYFFAGAVLLTVSFFSYWLLSHDWWGQAVFFLGLAIGFGTIVRAWFFHTANVLVITSERVIRVVRRGWFDELVTSLYFDDIYDTTVRRQGILGRFCNYGTIVLRAKESGRAVEMNFLKDPSGVEQAILDQREIFQNKKERTDVEGVYGNFLVMVPKFSPSELRAAAEAIERRLAEQQAVARH